MIVHRGDFVLVAFPFASGVGSKRRPALVVQNDHGNSRMANTIIAAVTTTTHRSNAPSQLLIDPQSPQYSGTGLLLPSVVTCETLATIERRLITRIIGRLPAAAIPQIDACLKAALGLH